MDQERDDQTAYDEPDEELDDVEQSDAVASDEAVASIEELVRFLVEHLVDEPESVALDVERRGSTIHVQLNLPETEVGKVIGRGGRIAKAIRTVLLVAGSRHNVRVTLDIEG